LISRSLPPLEGISFKPERKRWAFKCEFDKFLLYTVLTIKVKKFHAKNVDLHTSSAVIVDLY